MHRNKFKAMAIAALFGTCTAPILPAVTTFASESTTDSSTDDTDNDSSHVWHATIYQNNDELKACIEAVLLGSNYADATYKYSKESAQKYYDEHKDKYSGLSIQPYADFAEQVCSHYKVTAKSILNVGSSSETSTTAAALQSEIESMVSTYSGTWSVYAKDLKTGKTISVNGSKSLVSASIIKVFIAGAYRQAVDDGKIKDTHDSDLKGMITVSDNECTNRLINALGMDYINSFIKKQGCSDTQLNRKMGTQAAAKAGKENYTTMEDCANVLEKIEKKTYVSSTSSARIKEYMGMNEGANKIRDALESSYKGVKVYNKTGEIAVNETYKVNAMGDVAIVESDDYPSGLLICINENGVAPSGSMANLRKIAKKIYEDLKNDTSDMSAMSAWAKKNIKQVQYSSFVHGDKGKQYQKYIVLHDTEGSGSPESVAKMWGNGGRSSDNGVAAHFVIGKDGSIVQCVPLDKIAHHAGFGDNGNDSKYGVSVDGRDKNVPSAKNKSITCYGMNSWSIGIEMVHQGNESYPEAQLKALDNLIAYIDQYFGNKSTIIDHKMWRKSNSDTSSAFAKYLANYQSKRTHN